MPPVYAVISFFSYRYFRSYTYYSLIESSAYLFFPSFFFLSVFLSLFFYPMFTLPYGLASIPSRHISHPLVYVYLNYPSIPALNYTPIPHAMSIPFLWPDGPTLFPSSHCRTHLHRPASILTLTLILIPFPICYSLQFILSRVFYVSLSRADLFWF